MNKEYEIAIIGGGTAGLTAAIYCRRAGKKVVVIERSSYGGQILLSSEVANYPAFAPSTGYDFALELYNQVKHLNVDFINDYVTGISYDVSSRKKFLKFEFEAHLIKADCIIIATGTESKHLGLTDENKYIGRGLSYCAVCDGAFHKGKNTAVVGGGNTALEEALYLSFLCKKVHLIVRSNAFNADATLIEDIYSKENIIVYFNTIVTELHGSEKLEGVRLFSTEKEFELNISGLFIAIGRIPQNRIFADLISLDNNGYIIAGDDCHTEIPGIFAAGDCRTKELRQLVTAASDGARASSEALKYLNGNPKKY